MIRTFVSDGLAFLGRPHVCTSNCHCCCLLCCIRFLRFEFRLLLVLFPLLLVLFHLLLVCRQLFSLLRQFHFQFLGHGGLPLFRLLLLFLSPFGLCLLLLTCLFFSPRNQAVFQLCQFGFLCVQFMQHCHGGFLLAFPLGHVQALLVTRE